MSDGGLWLVGASLVLSVCVECTVVSAALIPAACPFVSVCCGCLVAGCVEAGRAASAAWLAAPSGAGKSVLCFLASEGVGRVGCAVCVLAGTVAAVACICAGTGAAGPFADTRAAGSASRAAPVADSRGDSAGCAASVDGSSATDAVDAVDGKRVSVAAPSPAALVPDSVPLGTFLITLRMTFLTVLVPGAGVSLGAGACCPLLDAVLVSVVEAAGPLDCTDSTKQRT